MTYAVEENTIVSLCTGTGQLERALTLAGVRARLAYVADPSPSASAFLSVRHPDVPNLGDITKIDWTRLPSPFAITAGYPCQGFSLSGRRLGETDARFIWPYVFAGIRDLRPRVVLLENVPGHLSLGFGRVLGDLASIGYDANWDCLRASDVGAAHHRNRVFILAWQRGDNPAAALALPHGRPTGGLGGTDPVLRVFKTPTANLGENGGSQHPDKRKAGGHGPTLDDEVSHLLPVFPTPRARDGKGVPGEGFNEGNLPATVMALEGLTYADVWGEFGPAVERWEKVLGRPAPWPTDTGRRGVRRLSPVFAEWLMGHDEGAVTGLIRSRGAAGVITRTEAFTLIGNGVVALQGAEAFRRLTSM